MMFGKEISYRDCVDMINGSFFACFDGHYSIDPCTVYYSDGGVVRKDAFHLDSRVYDTSKLRQMCTQKKREFSREHFNDEKFILHTGNYFITEKIDKCVGKPVSDLNDEMERYRQQRYKRYLESVKGSERWLEFKSRFGDYVIGIDNNIDVFPTGFSVRVLFHTDKSFAERKQFVKDHKNDLLEYAIGELKDSKKVMKRIGDMRFYKPVLITTLRAAEAEIKFEIKRG